MSMQPSGSSEIPAETVRVARAAFPKGSLAIRVRDELGPVFRDEDFADLFASRGRPAWSPAGVKRDNTSSQAKGAFGLDAFTIDWCHQQVACPGGVTATSWYPRTDSKGLPVIQVRFPVSLCGPCPYLRSCVSSPTGRRRELMLRRQQAEHDAIRAIRREQQTDAWKERYKIHAGVEGTISQAVGRCGLRRSRYRGLTKTSIQHQLAGAAINLARIDAHLTGTPRARTRTSHFAALCPVELTLDGAQQGPN